MLRPPFLLIAASAILLARSAAGELCTATQSGTWGPIGAGSAAWSCSGAGSPTPDDHFVIPNGITVQVVADVVQDGVNPGTGIRVLAGGTLRAEVDGQTVTAPPRIAFNGSGLACDAGSSCVFRGGYRQFGAASPTVKPTLAQAGWLRAGDVVPCPDGDGLPDCAGLDPRGTGQPGSAAVVRVSYPRSVYRTLAVPGGVPGDSYTGQGIAGLAPGDALCFFDPDESTPAAPVDDGFCYEIVARSGSPNADPGFIDLDVRQTDPSAPRDTKYPLARRVVKQVGLEGAVAAGDRVLETDAGVITADGEFAGRFVRFADAGGNPLDGSQKIATSANDVTCDAPSGLCDRFEIHDPLGFTAAHGAGELLWIDYGWASGDPFYVMAPVVLAAASGIERTSPSLDRVALEGDASLAAVLVDRTSGLDLHGADVSAFEHVWFRDTAAGNNNALEFIGVIGAALRRVSFTGGSSLTGFDRLHTVVFHGGNANLELENLAIRHHGDDCVSNSTSYTATYRRFRCEWASDEASSTNLVGVNNANQGLVGSITDALCVDCTDFSVVIEAKPGTDLDIAGLAVWGSSRPGGEDDGAEFTDLLVAGGTALQLPYRVDRFVLAGSAGTGRVLGPSHLSVRNGIVRDVATTQFSLAKQMADGLLENVIFLDVESTEGCSTSVCTALEMNAPVTGMTTENVSIVFSDAAVTAIDAAVLLRGNEAGLANHTVEGLLVVGMDASLGSGQGVNGTLLRTQNFFLDTTRGPLFFDNLADLTQPGGAPPSTITGSDPGFTDPAARRFDPAAGSAADQADVGIRRGIAAPGLRGYHWMHALTRVAPELMADDPDRDGVPTGDPGDDVCASGDPVDCADSCPDTFDPDQEDTDGDELGDACDATCPGLGETTALLSLSPQKRTPGKTVTVQVQGAGPGAVLRFGETDVALGAGSGFFTVTVPNLKTGQTVPVAVVNPAGCRSQEAVTLQVLPAASGSGGICGLLGAEAIPLLAALGLWRARRARIGSSSTS